MDPSQLENRTAMTATGALSLDFHGAKVVRSGATDHAPLYIADGLITDRPSGRAIDLRGFTLLPGIIDLHGDGFERHVAPRRGAIKDMSVGLRAAEAEIAANGITTAYLAQFMSWEGGLRGPEFADQVLCGLRDLRGHVVTDLRSQLRFEVHLLDEYPSLPKRIADWGVDYIVFNDHLPHERLAQNRKPPRLTGQALKAGRNPEDHFVFLLQLHARKDEIKAALQNLCPQLTGQGVRMGSHDDTGPRDEWRALKVDIAEFPETLSAVENARGPVILGAPNLVRGGSHRKNISALDVVTMGLCDALASDYHYPSLCRSALMLARGGILDLPGAWALISSGPARIMGFTDRGALRPDYRADLIALDAQDHIALTISGGRVSYMSGEIAKRFVQ